MHGFLNIRQSAFLISLVTVEAEMAHGLSFCQLLDLLPVFMVIVATH